jgi:hypothetical protein
VAYLTRLEPRSRSGDLTASLAARIADPLWMLARQWQLGELLGDDASTPVATEHIVEARGLTSWQPSDGGSPTPYDPAAAPLEAVVEAQPPIWTARLAVDVGRELARQLRAMATPADAAAVTDAFPLSATLPAGAAPDPAGLRLRALAAGRVPDGGAAYLRLAPGLDASLARLQLPAGVTVTQPDTVLQACTEWLAWCRAAGLLPARDQQQSWRPGRHEYSFSVSATTDTDTVKLSASEYTGGGLDWYSFDATTTGGTDPGLSATQRRAGALPVPARFPGMPDPRWWTFEDGHFDLGQVDANPADLALMVVLEFALVFGNDFFVAPVRLSAGSLCRTTALLVTDNYGITTRIRPMASGGAERVQQGAERWTMFTMSDGSGGLSDYFLLSPGVAQRLTSAPVEDVLMLRDEMANMAWVVESRYEGDAGEAVDRAEQDRRPPAPEPPETSGLRYVIATTVPPNWYPLVPSSGARGPVLTVEQMAFGAGANPAPAGVLVRIGDVIEDEEVPREGRRLRRERVLTRWIDGSTQVWRRNRAGVGRGEGSSGLRFDVATTER